MLFEHMQSKFSIFEVNEDSKTVILQEEGGFQNPRVILHDVSSLEAIVDGLQRMGYVIPKTTKPMPVAWQQGMHQPKPTAADTIRYGNRKNGKL